VIFPVLFLTSPGKWLLPISPFIGPDAPIRCRMIRDHPDLSPGDLIILNDPSVAGPTRLISRWSLVFVRSPESSQPPVCSVYSQPFPSRRRGHMPWSPIAREILRGLIIPLIKLIQAGGR
jgi:hypothetical protein